MKHKTEEQLNEYIEKLKGELEAAESRAQEADNELETLKNAQEDGRNTWAQPLEWDEDDLPLPRLELHWECVDEYESRCWYVLVRAHLLDDPKRKRKRNIVATPLGMTTSRGVRSERGFMLGDEVETPFRDNAHAKHDALRLGLPLFVTTDEGNVDQVVFAVGATDWRQHTQVKHRRVKK